MKKPVISLNTFVRISVILLLVLHFIGFFTAERYFIHNYSFSGAIPLVIFLGCPILICTSLLFSLFAADRLVYLALPTDHPDRSDFYYSIAEGIKEFYEMIKDEV